MADSIIVRLLLGVIVIAFIGFGVKDVLQTTNNFDIVTFSDAKNITEHDFLKAKSEEIAIIQKQNNIHLTDEDIKELEIDRIILQKLINNSILNYITKYYDLDLSEKTVIQFIKQAPIFTNSYGEFDIQIFHSIVKNSYQKEEEYLQRLKEEILKSALLNVFAETFYVPDVMVGNIVDYLAEKRELDLVQIDLNYTVNNFIIPTPTKDQLISFYQDHKDIFTLPEMRNLSYTIIPNAIIKQKIDINDDEIEKFYQDNLEDFDNKSFDQVKKQVITALKQQKFDELRIEFNKNLEDDVASGLTLSEIAAKYDFVTKNISNITYTDILNKKTALSPIVADSVFEMTAGEVSYPIEISNDLLLVEVNTITTSTLEPFDTIKSKVEKIWKTEYLHAKNLEKLNEIAKTYNSKNIDLKQLKSVGIIVGQKSLIRGDQSNIIPEELNIAVFQSTPGSNTSVFDKNNKAYFAHIKSIKIDSTKARNANKNDRINIVRNIRQGIVEEMIQHFKQKNKIKINSQHSVFKNTGN